MEGQSNVSSRAMRQKTMLMVAINKYYILLNRLAWSIYRCIMTGVELMHDSVVGIGRRRQSVFCKYIRWRDYSSIPQQRQSRLGGGKKRQSEWAELVCIICV